jgi:hypothetical protein
MTHSQQPLVFNTRGNIELLSQNRLALFASQEFPEELRADLDEFFGCLLHLPLGLAGGWQSPLERQLYARFHASMQANVIHYFARDINQLVLTPLQSRLMEKGKLLMIAPDTGSPRVSKALVKKRDRLLFAQNRKICFLFIRPGGMLEQYFAELLQTGHAVYVFDHKVNEKFKMAGAIPLTMDDLEVLQA